LEVILQEPSYDIEEPGSVFFVNQPVMENSLTLVDPKTEQHFFAGEVVVFDFQDSLEDLAEISQVEGVVGLGWGWEKLVSNFGVDL